MCDDKGSEHKEKAAASGTSGHFEQGKKSPEEEGADEGNVVKIFAELKRSREVPDFDKPGDKKAGDKKENSNQIKYVFVDLNDSEGKAADDTEEDSQNGVSGDKTRNEKERHKERLFL